MRPSWTKRVSSTFAPVSLFRSSSSSARLHTHAALSIARFLNVCLKITKRSALQCERAHQSRGLQMQCSSRMVSFRLCHRKTSERFRQRFPTS